MTNLSRFFIGLTFILNVGLVACKKDKQEACISRSSNWFSNDTILVNDSVYFRLCNLLAPKSTECIWDFGDGTVAYGIEVTHSWDSAGIYIVKLTVPGGEPDIATVTIVVTKADGYTFAGNFNCLTTVFKEDTTYNLLPYSASIAALTISDIVITNLFNDSKSINATVNGNNLFIPVQVFVSDTVSGSGNLTSSQSKIGIVAGISSPSGREVYSVSLKR